MMASFSEAGRVGNEMSVAVTRTEAEEQLVRQFAKVAPELPGGARVAELRSKAIAGFALTGLPHRRIEDWKYTDLRTGIKAAYPPAVCSQAKVGEALIRAALGTALAGVPCIALVMLNGRYVAKMLPRGQEAGTGWEFRSLAAAMGEPDRSWFWQNFERDVGGSESAVQALNTAFLTDGIVLKVREGARLELPIHVISITDAKSPVALATRTIIRIEPGAHATVIESHVGISHASTARQATAVTEISLGEAAEARHIQYLSGGADVVHLGRWHVSLGKDAVYRGFQLTAGVGLARNETHIQFTGPDAKLDLSGLMLGRGKDHIDTTLVVNHTTTGCEGRELFKAVLDDRARAVFQGKVIVAPEAQKTDGKQMAQALMLSEDAEFDSKPELEIYADDVACGHGSTAAELDEDMLFYLRSRGIPLADARAMLIESFATEALEKIEDETLREAARAIAVAWLGGATAR
jgi:Fe-S cluster assembly protein SufD